MSQLIGRFHLDGQHQSPPNRVITIIMWNIYASSRNGNRHCLHARIIGRFVIRIVVEIVSLVAESTGRRNRLGGAATRTTVRRGCDRYQLKKVGKKIVSKSLGVVFIRFSDKAITYLQR